MFTVTELAVGYGQHTVLSGVHFDAQPGDCVAILGRNGAGKTTLINALAGVIESRSGDVTLYGRSLQKLSADKRNAAGITLVPQGHRVFRSLSVDEHLRIAEQKRGNTPFTIAGLYRQFPVLDARRHQRAGTLSGGEQQILALARALIGNGSVVLMDEPTEGLDPAKRALLVDTIKTVCDNGAAVVLVEQRVDAALAVASNALLLNAGKLEPLGAIDALKADPAPIIEKLGMTTQ
ncbi:MAG: ATP-binding cassette domain-containing protein [Nitriliruptoraceae bacterium]